MFNQCTSFFKMPEISKWDVGNVKYMINMFNCCAFLAYLSDIFKWNVKNVINMHSMFQCFKDVQVYIFYLI